MLVFETADAAALARIISTAVSDSGAPKPHFRTASIGSLAHPDASTGWCPQSVLSDQRDSGMSVG